jgi:hypothetical protein
MPEHLRSHGRTDPAALRITTDLPTYGNTNQTWSLRDRTLTGPRGYYESIDIGTITTEDRVATVAGFAYEFGHYATDDTAADQHDVDETRQRAAA